MTFIIPNSNDPAVWQAAVQATEFGVVDLVVLLRAATRMAKTKPNCNGWAALKSQILALIRHRRRVVYNLQSAELCCHPRHLRATGRQINCLRAVAHDPKAYNRALIQLIQGGRPGKPDPMQYVRCRAVDEPNRALPFLGSRLKRKFTKTAPKMTAEKVRLARKVGWDSGYDEPNDGADFLVLVEAFRYFGPSMREWEWENFEQAHAEGRWARAKGVGGVRNPYRRY